MPDIFAVIADATRRDLLKVLLDASLCGLGGLTPFPVTSAIRHFPADFDRAPV